jgi:hypothetical protein
MVDKDFISGNPVKGRSCPQEGRSEKGMGPLRFELRIFAV